MTTSNLTPGFLLALRVMVLLFPGTMAEEMLNSRTSLPFKPATGILIHERTGSRRSSNGHSHIFSPFLQSFINWNQYSPLLFTIVFYAVTVRVLVVGDHPEQRLLAMLLRRAGYSVVQVIDSGEALREIIDRRHEILILTVEPPQIEGVDFLPVVRRLTEVPIVVIGPPGEKDAVQALLQGADIYVTRPIDPDEFLARMAALLRRLRIPRHPGAGSDVMEFADFAGLRNRLSSLTPVESMVLESLPNDQGTAVSHDDRKLNAWGEHGKSSSLCDYIRQLSRLLGGVPFGGILNLRTQEAAGLGSMVPLGTLQ